MFNDLHKGSVLNLFNGKRGVWLVKVPKYISSIQEKTPDNTEVGKES